MRANLSLIALMGAMIFAGCGGGGTPSQTAQSDSTGAPAPPTSDNHLVAIIVPGSYEDWCEEHAVPETQCTRCDPSLIPAFQAANDWDAEHGLPMSQCAIHDPTLKVVRPPKREGK